MTVTNSDLLLKFRGCMVGSLIGDCLREFHFNPAKYSKKVLEGCFSYLLSGECTRTFCFSDDTCMTLSVARSLIKNKKIRPKDLAKRFVNEYFSQPKRGYGINAIDVFETLKETNFEDVFLPGQMQFCGSGNFGNGAAMRIAPIALFGRNKTDESLQRDVEKCSRITHYHPNGCNGAILQCFAVRAALKCDSSKDFDSVEFINQLEKKMENIEKKDDSPYCESLKKIKEIYLQDHEGISSDEVAESLHSAILAHKSVPIAIYSFLRGMKPLSECESPNPFVRTIYFAISVGEETDTIPGLAGSIAGAYYGIDAIPAEMYQGCEFKNEVDDVAHKLFDASQESTCNLV